MPQKRTARRTGEKLYGSPTSSTKKGSLADREKKKKKGFHAATCTAETRSEKDENREGKEKEGPSSSLRTKLIQKGEEKRTGYCKKK